MELFCIVLAALVLLPACSDREAVREFADRDRCQRLFDAVTVEQPGPESSAWDAAQPVAGAEEVLAEYVVRDDAPTRQQFSAGSGEGRVSVIPSRNRDSGLRGISAPAGEQPRIRVRLDDLHGDTLQRARGIRLRTYSPGRGVARVRASYLSANSRRIRTSEWSNGVRGDDIQVHDLHLLAPTAAEEAPFELLVQFAGGGSHAVVGVKILSWEPGAKLPTPSQPRLMAVGTENIRAAGIVEGRPWRIETAVPRGARLQFTAFVPPAYREAAAEGPLRLVLRANHGGAVKVAEAEVPADDAWHTGGLSFPADVEGAVTVTINLVDDGDAAVSAALIGDLLITAPTAAPKTVVLITSDTHRADYLSGSSFPSLVKTPAIDRLAERGIVFDNCFSTTNVTTPSHAAIMTGLHPKVTRVLDNFTRAAAHAETLAEAFSRGGFRTFASTSVAHLSEVRSGLGQGFDRYAAPTEGHYRAPRSIQTLKAWLDDAEGDNVFAWLHIFDAHTPYAPPGADVPAVDEADRLKITPNLIGGFDVPQWMDSLSVASLDDITDLYGREVEVLDGIMGDFLSAPRIQDAWVAFTSDHGEFLGEHDVWFSHSGLFQPTLQIPLILAGPGMAPMRTDAEVQQIAVGRTLLDLAGVAHSFPGPDLVAMAERTHRGQRSPEPRYALSAFGTQASVAAGRWLLVMDLRTARNKERGVTFLEAGRVGLFDLTLGMTRDQDFVDLEPAIAAKMSNKLIKWLQRPEATPSLATKAEVSESEMRDMRELGYSGPSEPTPTTWWNPKLVTAPEWRAFHGLQ